MTPSRELDALVAEKVMGWKRDNSKAYLSGDLGRPFELQVWTIPGEGKTSVVPTYSTDIAAAWEVVEKFKSKWVFSLNTNGEMATVKFIEICSGPGGDLFPGIRAEVTDPEVPRAIALAALKAVGVEV